MVEGLCRFEYSLASLNTNTNTETQVSQTGANADLNSDMVQSFATEVVSREVLSTEDAFPAYLTQPVTLHNMVWTTAMARGIEALCCADVVQAWLAAAPPSTLAKISTFAYMTTDVELTFIVQGAAPAFGQLIFFAIPTPREEGGGGVVSRYDYVTYSNVRILPHVIIDPSKSATYKLLLPMASTTGVYDLKDKTRGSWEVRSIVYNPLGSGTATNVDVRVTVRSSLTNPRMSGRTRPLGPDADELSGKPSAIIAGLGRAAGFLGSAFPSVSPYTTLFSGGANLASKALRAFGFSKPQTLSTDTFMLNRTCDNYSQTDGRSTALVLGRSQAQASSIDPGLMGGEMSDMSISHLLSKPVAYSIFGIPQTTPANTAVVTIFVDPWNLNEADNPSFAGLMADNHEFWCGPITYHFEFIASVFHRATLLIAWDPRNTGVPPTYVEALNHLENVTVQVSGNTSVDVDVPWRQSALARSTTVSPRTNGQLYVFVVNPVVANGSTDGIYVNVLKTCDRLQFFAPRITAPIRYTGKPIPAAEALFAEGVFEEPTSAATIRNPDELGNETVTPLIGDWVESTSHSFGPSVATGDMSAIVTGDQSTTVKDLTSRMLLIAIMTDPAEARWTIRAVPWRNQGGTTATYMTWFQLLVPLFMGHRGSFRWTIEGTDRNTMVQYRMENTSGNIVTSNPSAKVGSYATTFVNSKVASNTDVVAPYLYNQMFYPGSTFQPAITRGTISTLVPAATSVGVFSGTGDDFVFGKFLGVPRYVAAT